jgi:5-hydroxyisourate hydrolase
MMAAAPVAGASKPTTISSHCLDTTMGVPAKDLALSLEEKIIGQKDGWRVLGRASTNADGRVVNKDWGTINITPGIYRVYFDLTAYYARQGISNFFFPEASVVFQIREQDLGGHFHIPLLLSPFGYTTYRGS